MCGQSDLQIVIHVCHVKYFVLVELTNILQFSVKRLVSNFHITITSAGIVVILLKLTQSADKLCNIKQVIF